MSEVEHVPDRSRFVVVEGEARAVLTYVLGEGVVTFEHTVVPDELEGKGVGSRLATAALDWARGEGLAVVPQCPFVRAFLERHPEAGEGLEIR